MVMLRHGVEVKLAEDLLAHLALGGLVGRAVAVAQPQAEAAQHHHGDKNEGELFAIHLAAVFLRFTTARPIHPDRDQQGHGGDVDPLQPGLESVDVFAQLFADLFEIALGLRLLLLEPLDLVLYLGRQDEALALVVACCAAVQ